MLIDNIQAKNFVKFDFMKIIIHLAWVDNSMVIFSASYKLGSYKKKCTPIACGWAGAVILLTNQAVGQEQFP